MRPPETFWAVQRKRERLGISNASFAGAALRPARILAVKVGGSRSVAQFGACDDHRVD